MTSFETINPYNNRQLETYTYDSYQIYSDKLEKSHHSFLSWRKMSAEKRAEIILNFVKIAKSNREKLSKAASLEMGKLISESRAEVDKCFSLIEYFCHNAKNFLFPEVIETDGIENTLHYQPLGVVLGVMPWNFPYWQIMRFSIPTLLAGNSVLIKPAIETPKCALLLEEIFHEVFKPDQLENLFQVSIFEHSELDKVMKSRYLQGVTFTGSVEGGRKIYESAAKNLKKVVLELGGSDPFIVLEDANMDKVIDGAYLGKFLNCGQTCIASKRFYIHQSKYEEFITGMKSKVSMIKMGQNPLDEQANFAPIYSQKGLEKLIVQVNDAREKGANVFQFKDINDIEKQSGNFYPPTIITDVNSDMMIFHEEVFGPVMIVYSFEKIQEVIDTANNSEFGLGGSIWSQNLESAKEIALQLDCGATFVNSIVKSDPKVPFGGIKNSGVGRELGRHGMLEFTNLKSVNIYS